MLSCLEKGENTTPAFQTMRFEGATDHMWITQNLRTLYYLDSLPSVLLVNRSSISLIHSNPRLSIFPHFMGFVKTQSSISLRIFFAKNIYHKILGPSILEEWNLVFCLHNNSLLMYWVFQRKPETFACEGTFTMMQWKPNRTYTLERVTSAISNKARRTSPLTIKGSTFLKKYLSCQYNFLLW